VAIGAGISVAPITPRHAFRLSFHFGLFQFLMPVIGWFVGSEVAGLIGVYDHWVAFALLVFIGGKMLWEAHVESESRHRKDPTRGMSLVVLSIATSLDALAVGLSMAMLQVSILIPSVVIGLVAGGMTLVGISFGSRIGIRWSRWAETVGGCVLLLIGFKLLFV
jgi:manganese efflux pump family protein